MSIHCYLKVAQSILTTFNTTGNNKQRLAVKLSLLFNNVKEAILHMANHHCMVLNHFYKNLLCKAIMAMPKKGRHPNLYWH